MAFTDCADWDRPIAFQHGGLYHGYGGGPFRVEPEGCSVERFSTGEVSFKLELVRSIVAAESRTLLSCQIVANYSLEAALSVVRSIDPKAVLTPLTFTNWSFRFEQSPLLQSFPQLLQPVGLVSNGVGSARLLMQSSLDAGLMLETLLQSNERLEGIAEAVTTGISPRVPAVVHINATSILEELLSMADINRALPRAVIVEYFQRDLSSLPLVVDGDTQSGSRSFAEAITDRFVQRFGRFVEAQSRNVSPVVQLEKPVGTVDLIWSLSQAMLAERRISIPVDLLSAAQTCVREKGIAHLVARRDEASLPLLGQVRITILFNALLLRSGVEACGVTLVFPPHLPARPQARTITIEFDHTTDVVEVNMRLSPGEDLAYTYSTFMVWNDGENLVQTDCPPVSETDNVLRLDPGAFPLQTVCIEATAALISLARVSGTCRYEIGSKAHARPFALEAGILLAVIAIPREAEAVQINAIATSRDGTGLIAFANVASTAVRYDPSSLPTYGPRTTLIRCAFDDVANLRAVSLLPQGMEDVPSNVTSLVLTPSQPEHEFHWYCSSPFADQLRYKAHNATSAPWAYVRSDQPVLLKSSQLGQMEYALPVATMRETSLIRKSHDLMLAELKSDQIVQEDALVPVGRCDLEIPTDLIFYTGTIDSGTRLYVPAYRLGIDMTNTGERFQVAFIQGNTMTSLQIGLDIGVPAPLQADAAGALEYPHKLKVELSYLIQPPATARKLLAFTEIMRDGSHIWAKLTFASLLERDEVYRALTDEGRAASLAVTRTIDVMVLVPPPPPRPPSGSGGVGGHNTGGPSSPFPLRRIPVVWPPLVKYTLPTDVLTIPDTILTKTTLTPKLSVLQPGLAIQAKGLAEFGREKIIAPALGDTTFLLRHDKLDTKQAIIVDTVPTPEVSCSRTIRDGSGASVITLSVNNWKTYSEDLFSETIDKGADGSMEKSSRTIVEVLDADTGKRLYSFNDISSAQQLQMLTVPLNEEASSAKKLHVKLVDKATLQYISSNFIDLADVSRVAPTEQVVRSDLLQTVSPKPFAFSPQLHAYIFEGVALGSGSAPQLIRHTIAWNGVFHSYLQDATRRSVIYIFPDRYKLARRREPPFLPYATVRVTSQADGTNTTVIFDYIIAPYFDTRRLDNARERLLQMPQLGATEIDFQLLPTSDMTFSIDRPTQAGSVREARTGFVPVLGNAIKDSLTIPLPDFKLLFDAMYQPTAALFIGKIEIAVPGGRAEVIPFEARLADLEGDIFAYMAASEGANLRVQLFNAIESPVDIQTLDVTITSGGEVVRATVLPGALPRTNLRPAESLELVIAPSRPPPDVQDVTLDFNLTGIKIRVDPEAVWNTILDTTSVDYFRLITVKAVSGHFAAPADNPERRIETILVEFESGGTAELMAANLVAQLRVDYPISAVILNQTANTTYKYKLTVIRADGSQSTDTAFRSGTAQVFFVNLQP